MRRRLLAATHSLLRRTTPLHHQEGISLVEVLVAVAITGSAIIMLLSSLSTGSKAVGILYERVIAEDLARSQLEYTKSQSYLVAPASYAIITPLPHDFTVYANALAVTGRNNNIQKIVVTVYRNNKPLLVKEDFKVNR